MEQDLAVIDAGHYGTEYFFIRDNETWMMVLLPSKYLAHLTKANRSPNTVKRSARSIQFYLDYHVGIPIFGQTKYLVSFFVFTYIFLIIKFKLLKK